MVDSIKKVVNSHYYLNKYVRSVYRYSKYFRMSVARYIRFYNNDAHDLNPQVIQINPNAAIIKSAFRCCKFTDLGRVMGGEWDREVVRFDQCHHYESYNHVFEKGGHWKETPYYRYNLARINRGEIFEGCKSVDDLNERFQKLNELYESIKDNGFKLKKDLTTNEDKLDVYDDVVVHIGRNGELILEDGNNRLAIAKVLKLSQIPVRAGRRHEKWVGFKKQVRFAIELDGGMSYQPLLHPDLMNVKSAHRDNRYDIICPHLPKPPATLLDIGANWGYFCQKFEEAGYQCVAVENDPEHSYFLRRFKDIGGKRFRVVTKSIFDFNETKDFDVVLALNVFHHFIKYQELHDQLAKYLSELRAKMIIFEPHLTKEFDGMNYYRNYANEEFVAFVMQHAKKNHSECIGKASDGRPIYKLT